MTLLPHSGSIHGTMLNPAIEQKSQEIAFAVLRIAAYVRRAELRKRIENLAYDLVADIGLGNEERSINTANGLIALVRFGGHLLAIEPNNTRILIKELTNLSADIANSTESSELPDLETYFSRKGNTATVNAAKIDNQAKEDNTA